MNNLRIRVLAAFILAIICVSCRSALATPTVQNYGPFRVTFYNTGDTDDSGTTTGDQDWTAEQMNDVAACINTWDAKIADMPGRQVELHMFWDTLPQGVLGSASSARLGASGKAYSYAEYVWRQGINAGASSYGYDSRIRYSPAFAWNFGADAPAFSEFDFRSVITHEIGHTLGWSGSYSSTDDRWWSGGITAWDSFLRDDAGNMPFQGTSGTPGNFNQVDNPVWFIGSHAVAANGGDNVPIYAPDPYKSGSSLAHLDDSLFQNALMSYSIGNGQMVREPGTVEWAVMEDLGWTVVPEPGSLGLLAVGALALILHCRFGQTAKSWLARRAAAG